MDLELICDFGLVVCLFGVIYHVGQFMYEDENEVRWGFKVDDEDWYKEVNIGTLDAIYRALASKIEIRVRRESRKIQASLYFLGFLLILVNYPV